MSIGQIAGLREWGPDRLLGGLGDQGLGGQHARQPGEAGDRGGSAEEVAAAQPLLWMQGRRPLVIFGIGELARKKPRGMVGGSFDHGSVTFSQL